jgi:hypothetical protein
MFEPKKVFARTGHVYFFCFFKVKIDANINERLGNPQ